MVIILAIAAWLVVTLPIAIFGFTIWLCGALFGFLLFMVRTIWKMTEPVQ